MKQIRSRLFKIIALIIVCTMFMLSMTGCSTLQTLFEMGSNGATVEDFMNNAGPLTEQAIDEAKPMLGEILTGMGEAMGEVGEVLQEESCAGHCECTCGGCPLANSNQTEPTETTETQ